MNYFLKNLIPIYKKKNICTPILIKKNPKVYTDYKTRPEIWKKNIDL